MKTRLLFVLLLFSGIFIVNQSTAQAQYGGSRRVRQVPVCTDGVRYFPCDNGIDWRIGGSIGNRGIHDDRDRYGNRDSYNDRYRNRDRYGNRGGRYEDDYWDRDNRRNDRYSRNRRGTNCGSYRYRNRRDRY